MRIAIITVFLCFATLLKVPVLIGAEVDEKFRQENRIFLDSDLDCDGQDELISLMKNIHEKLKIYYKEGEDYKPVECEDDLNLSDEIQDSFTRFFVIDSKDCKNIVLVTSIWKYLEGKSYGLGNAIIIYRFKNKKLNIIKRYISEYDFEKEAKDIPETPLTRYPIEVVLKSNNNDSILIQGYEYLYLIDDSGELLNLKKKVIPNKRIAAFNYDKKNIKILLKDGNKFNYYLWDINTDKLGEPISPIFKRTDDIIFENDKLIFNARKNGKKGKVIYSIKNDKMTKESEVYEK